MKDGRSKTSAENGKKGGRPKGYSALQAEQTRIKLCEVLEKEWKPIVLKAVEQAKKGDRYAREWLFDRGYGKAVQSVAFTDPEGDSIFNEDVKQKSKEVLKEFIGKD